jgi:hypothetical protein
MRGGGEGTSYIAREAQLLAVSLTLNPCTVAATPIRCLPGDIRRPLDRFKWPGSWAYHTPLLGRAFETLGTGVAAEKRTASYIADQRYCRHRAEADGEPWVETRPTPQSSREAEWRKHGPGARIEWSRHPGKVLRVS